MQLILRCINIILYLILICFIYQIISTRLLLYSIFVKKKKKKKSENWGQ